MSASVPVCTHMLRWRSGPEPGQQGWTLGTQMELSAFKLSSSQAEFKSFPWCSRSGSACCGRTFKSESAGHTRPISGEGLWLWDITNTGTRGVKTNMADNTWMLTVLFRREVFFHLFFNVVVINWKGKVTKTFNINITFWFTAATCWQRMWQHH